mmetsp:Transcript_60938/g.164050  ORF Transcript_60938/g.164050 Transcript_60938/m.164050 type:complete len:100 (-) Transcript_60938:25-324(-)
MFVQVTLAAVLFACVLSLPLQHRNPEAGGAELLLAHVVMTAGKSDRALGMPPPKELCRAERSSVSKVCLGSTTSLAGLARNTVVFVDVRSLCTFVGSCA